MKTFRHFSWSLAETVRRAQAGELAAFRELVLGFQDMAVGYAFSLLGDFHLAEDAAQDAFLAAFQELDSLRQPGAFVPWLRTVVGKHCDRIRRRRRPTEALETDAERLVVDSPSPLDVVERDEVAGLVGRAIASLPANQRDVVTLYYIGEQSGRQVAAFLDVPLTTVKKRLHDSKPKLRRSMTKMAKQFLEDHKPSRDSEFSERVLRLVAPDPSKDSAAVYSLFEAEDHPNRHEWRAGRLADSHADWNVSRIAFAREGGAERLVAALNAYDMTMHVGGAEVRVAGINGDVLGADMAGSRGDIFDRVAADAIAAMRGAGYDLAVTFDDEAFWLRRGFALGWRALQWQVLVADLPVAEVPELERFEATHRDDLAAVYNATTRRLTGTVRRPTYRRNKHPGHFSTYSWRGAGGAGGAGGGTAGYVSGSPGPGETCFWVDEVAGEADTCLARISHQAACRRQKAHGFQEVDREADDRADCGLRWPRPRGSFGPVYTQACACAHAPSTVVPRAASGAPMLSVASTRTGPKSSAIITAPGEKCGLAVLRAIAEAEQCTELYFDRLHYKSAVGVRLRQTGSCRLFTGTKSAKARWYVARIVNLKSLATKLAPMLHERLLASGLADWRGSLSICLECEGASEVVTLVARDGGMAVRDGAVGPNAISGDQAVTQLLLGCEEADEVVAVNGVEVCGDAARILPVLFPAQYPQMENQAL